MFTTKVSENDGVFSFDVPVEVVRALGLAGGSDVEVATEGRTS